MGSRWMLSPMLSCKTLNDSICLLCNQKLIYRAALVLIDLFKPNLIPAQYWSNEHCINAWLVSMKHQTTLVQRFVLFDNAAVQSQKAVFDYFTSEPNTAFWLRREEWVSDLNQSWSKVTCRGQSMRGLMLCWCATQRQTAVTAYFSSEQLLLFVFSLQSLPAWQPTKLKVAWLTLITTKKT